MSEDFSGKSPDPQQKRRQTRGHRQIGNTHLHSEIGQFILPTILIAGLVFLLRIAAISPLSSEIAPIPGEDILEIVVGYAVLMCELFAAAVIGIAAIQGMLRYLRTNFQSKPIHKQISNTESNRLRMGHRLSLALEFAVAADILRLAISPRINHLIVVFAIILLRVLLNYFLEHDSQTIRECHYVEELEGQNSDEYFDSNSEDCCG